MQYFLTFHFIKNTHTHIGIPLNFMNYQLIDSMFPLPFNCLVSPLHNVLVKI